MFHWELDLWLWMGGNLSAWLGCNLNWWIKIYGRLIHGWSRFCAFHRWHMSLNHIHMCDLSTITLKSMDSDLIYTLFFKTSASLEWNLNPGLHKQCISVPPACLLNCRCFCCCMFHRFILYSVYANVCHPLSIKMPKINNELEHMCNDPFTLMHSV